MFTARLLIQAVTNLAHKFSIRAIQACKLSEWMLTFTPVYFEIEAPS